MTHTFDAEKTKQFFDSLEGHFSAIKSPREDLFFDNILPQLQKSKKAKLKVVDFGCGGGGLLLRLFQNGCDAAGVEKHVELFTATRNRISEHNFDATRVINAGVEGLKQLGAGSQDLIIVMGVFQYLSDGDYRVLFEEIHKALTPEGSLVCSFQNALFDLFTFNKYTLDFIEHWILDGLKIRQALGAEIASDLKSLVTNPEFPPDAANRARDNIFVRTTNPLTIAEELEGYGFALRKKYFYDFHFVPTVIEKKYAPKLAAFTAEYQKNRSGEWFGNFTANAFLVHCTKAGRGG